MERSKSKRYGQLGKEEDIVEGDLEPQKNVSMAAALRRNDWSQTNKIARKRGEWRRNTLELTNTNFDIDRYKRISIMDKKLNSNKQCSLCVLTVKIYPSVYSYYDH